MRLNHVSLAVADQDRSADFYGRYFGLTERVHDDGDLLILGADDGALLALSTADVPPELPRTVHFGFRVTDGDAVHAARQRFADEGIAETEWQDDGRFTRVQVADPDGYLVDVFAY